MSESRAIRLSCPVCETGLPWKPEYAGRVARCKSCSTRIRLPKKSDGEVAVVEKDSKPAEDSDQSSAPQLPRMRKQNRTPGKKRANKKQNAQQTTPCISCGMQIPDESVLCTECGTNQITGNQLGIKQKSLSSELDIIITTFDFPLPRKESATIREARQWLKRFGPDGHAVSKIPILFGGMCAAVIFYPSMYLWGMTDLLNGVPYIIRMAIFFFIGIISIAVFTFSKSLVDSSFGPEQKIYKDSQKIRKKRVNVQLSSMYKYFLGSALLIVSLFSYGIPLLFAYLILRKYPRQMDREKLTLRNGREYFWKDLDKAKMAAFAYIGQPVVSNVFVFQARDMKFRSGYLLFGILKYVKKLITKKEKVFFYTHPCKNAFEVSLFVLSLFDSNKDGDGRADSYQSVYDFD